MTAMRDYAPHDIDDDGLLITVTSRAARFERAEYPSMRWFTAALTRESFDEATYETATVTQLATCEVVLISCKYGLETAYLDADADADADAEDGSLAAVVEELLELERRQLLPRVYPHLSTVLVVDAFTADDQDSGHELSLLREIAGYFDFIPGTALVAAFASPAGADTLDPFTLRAQHRRLDTLLSQASLRQLGKTGAWCALAETLTTDPATGPTDSDR